MKPMPKPATLLNTLSLRVDDATYARIVAAAKRERRRLSDYIRLLIERAELVDR
jgi:uncharacterized protein (DUF1778 family)